jgi:hypothetical protein
MKTPGGGDTSHLLGFVLNLCRLPHNQALPEHKPSPKPLSMARAPLARRRLPSSAAAVLISGTNNLMRPHWTTRLLAPLWGLLLLAGCVPVAAERHQTPTPGADAAAQATIAAVMAAGQPITETFPSPDGQWQVEIVVYDCVATGEEMEHAYELLRFAPADSDEWRQADSQLINCGGLGAFGLGGLCWSPDSRYFYYTPAREGVPDGAGEWSRPVWQLEAATGTIRELDEAAANIEGEGTLCTSAQP